MLTGVRYIGLAGDLSHDPGSGVARKYIDCQPEATGLRGGETGGLRIFIVVSLTVSAKWSRRTALTRRQEASWNLGGQWKRRALNAGGWTAVRTRLATVKGPQPTHMPA